jgi:hypothetical protein
MRSLGADEVSTLVYLLEDVKDELEWQGTCLLRHV